MDKALSSFALRLGHYTIAGRIPINGRWVRAYLGGSIEGRCSGSLGLNRSVALSCNDDVGRARAGHGRHGGCGCGRAQLRGKVRGRGIHCVGKRLNRPLHCTSLGDSWRHCVLCRLQIRLCVSTFVNSKIHLMSSRFQAIRYSQDPHNSPVVQSHARAACLCVLLCLTCEDAISQ